MDAPTVSAPRTSRIDRIAAWLLPFHPAAGLASVLLLSLRSRSVVRGLRTQSKDLYVWGALALVGWASVLAGVNVARGAVNWFIPFVFFWLYALGRWSVEDPEGFLRDLLRATGLLALIVVTARVLQLEVSVGGVRILDRFGPGERAYVLGQGVNGLAVILEVGAVGGLALLATAASRRARLEGAIVGAVSLAAVIVTLSRGAMVGIAGSAVVGTLLIHWRLLIWLSAAVLVAAASSPIVGSRLLSIFDLSRNVQRLRIWSGTWNLIRDHFWLGVGPGNFGLVYPLYRLPEEYEHARTPHNIYLNIASGWGVLGAVVLFGWIAWVMIRNLSQRMAPYKRSIFLILVAFWIHVLFDDLITPQAGLLLGLLDRDR